MFICEMAKIGKKWVKQTFVGLLEDCSVTKTTFNPVFRTVKILHKSPEDIWVTSNMIG